MPRKHAILTCSDARSGDFLANHWHRSLIENVDISDIDVIVFDYGLSKKHKHQIQAQGAICVECKADEGLIVNLRFRDFAHFLENRDYSQAASIDGGDIIFQSDISHLFREHSQQYRCVCEDHRASFIDFIIKGNDFPRETWLSLNNFLRFKQSITSGVIAPAEKFIELWRCFESFCTSFNEYGTDLVIINYLLHSNGFVPLNPRYNYCLASIHDRYQIRDGRFFDGQGKLIPVVHNAGGDTMRPIADFGYGSNYNMNERWMRPILFKTWLSFRHWLHRSFRTWKYQRIAASINSTLPFDTL